ncbi:MAG: bifunctional folylpolyglutamate synthase/dihydrofolate synthase, partial [candidate division WOR-3 bacterium]|nr:bifunctional folylpolyglutamate synthase/dihydrofolate synthase [candidate division WOR-3 bacterium]
CKITEKIWSERWNFVISGSLAAKDLITKRVNNINPQEFLESLINYERVVSPYYDFKLTKFREFLKLIGNPQKRLANVILIAGTKGKGSTAYFIEAGLRSAGFKTGLYTSPHLCSIRERIQVNGKKIPVTDFNRLVNKIRNAVQEADNFEITFFEALTAIAFLYFIEQKVDYTILEVGLGGRLDATNVVKPKVSVITRIGYDHIDILGSTLPQISYEKAGIIHPDSYVVIAKQRPSALKVIKKRIKKFGNSFCEVSKSIKIQDLKISMSGTEFNTDKFGKIRLKLLGRHQVENCANALAVFDYLKTCDPRINWEKIKLGLEKVQIPGRCQIVNFDPITIIDGAHNPESCQALVELIKELFKTKVLIIFGVSQGKLVNKMFKILAPVAHQFILTQSKNPRHIPVEALAKILVPYQVPYLITKSVKHAITLAKTQPKKIPIVITGSFYVAGEAMKLISKDPD